MEMKKILGFLDVGVPMLFAIKIIPPYYEKLFYVLFLEKHKNRSKHFRGILLQTLL